MNTQRLKNVYLESYGCTSNRFDLEVMVGQIFKAGYGVINVPELADILLVNTCGVKKPTEDRILERLRSLSLMRKPLLVAGCLPKINMKAIKDAAPNFSAVIDPHSVDKIVPAVESALHGEKNRVYFSEKPPLKLALPSIPVNRYVEVIQVSEGCLGKCSYCCVRFARGELCSYPEELIVQRAREAVGRGVVEVWLTAQDMGAYGRDIGCSLVDLLRKVVEVQGNFKVRVGMMGPHFALDMLNGLLEIYGNPKVYRFIHLPVQSGSDEVLESMIRPYRAADFKFVAEKLREAAPSITLATDIIVGFPTEKNEDFQQTIDLVKTVKPDVVNISRYMPRPSIEAAPMKQLPYSVVGQRSRMLSNIRKQISLERNMMMINKIEKLSVTEKDSAGRPVGRTHNYKMVTLDGGNLPGLKVSARIVKAHPRHLEGQIIKTPP